MAIQFSGEFTTPRSPDEVFDFLSDPKRFGPLLPDFQGMSMQDATHFTVKVKVGVGNIRGSAEIRMELAEAVRPLRAQYKGQGNAVGSQVTVSAGFDLRPLPESTRVVWQGETSVFGKLASMAGGMLEPLGRKNIEKLIAGLQKALAEPVAASSPQAVAPQMEAPASAPAESAPQQARASAPEEAKFSAGTGMPPSGPGESPGSSAADVTSSTPSEGTHGDDNAQPNR
ncbi:MAG TPA: SRPBCC domain-containing protein [Candidatus Binatia bacterium]|nr:SRPBCC domain-containing protein [Candidatus Binatia bacterium]